MKLIRKLYQFCLIAGLSLFISCGGGGSGPGASDPPPVSNPPPPDVTISVAAASKFLHQASYAPTLVDIELLADIGYEAWLNQQFNAPVSKHLDYIQSLPEIRWREHVNAWFMQSVNGDDQLRQRVAFALSEIWVVSLHGVDFPTTEVAFTALTNYYDILLEHAFGNFRDLMQAVTLNPVMGEYLSMKGNQKADPDNNILPDENFAREMMQLFTIGLHELNMDGTRKLNSTGNPIPTYDQTTIEAMARVFTGWHFANIVALVQQTEDIPDFINPMIVVEERHDQGQKTVVTGTSIPAGQTAQQDMQQILDIVFNHPNVPPFISKQLIQKLVTSNPSNAYIERVANVFADNGSGVRGDLRSVVKAILLDDEAINRTTSNGNIFGKLKEPLVRMAGLWRAFNASSVDGDYYLAWFNQFLGQTPLEAHHVFNFFSPSYAPQGSFQEAGLVAPEFEIHNEANQTKMTNFFQWLVISQNNLTNTSANSDEVLIDLSRERNLAGDINALMDHYNLLLFGGVMSDELRTVVSDYVATFPEDRPDQRAIEALGLLVVSPEYMIQD